MYRFVLSVLIVTFVPQSSSFAPAGTSPKPAASITAPETIARYFAAIVDGDIDTAISITLPVKGLPENAIREDFQEFSEFTKKNGTPQIVAHLQLGETAVVIFREKPGSQNFLDLDPAYLIKRDEQWQAVFELTEFDDGRHEIDEATLAKLRLLQDWFKSQKPVLKKLVRDGTPNRANPPGPADTDQ